MGRRSSPALLAFGFAMALSASAHAEAQEIRLAKQLSVGYLQFNILDHQKLIEKYAAAAGLGDLKITWATFGGPDAMDSAFVAGSVDVAAGGVPGLVTLWAKTFGTPEEIRGIAALSSQPFLLNTRNPTIKTLRDYTTEDHIAVPALKISVQAVTLEMAAAQVFGRDEYARLDPLTVSLAPSDASTRLLSGGGSLDSVFGVPPFQEQQLQDTKVHTILNSFEVLGGSHTFTLCWTSRKFHDANPKLYGALVAALKEATQILNADRAAAARLWIEDSNSKLDPALVEKTVSGPQVTWTMTPENSMKYANFMAEVGTIKTVPKSWKDLFFPEIYDLPGS